MHKQKQLSRPNQVKHPLHLKKFENLCQKKISIAIGIAFLSFSTYSFAEMPTDNPPTLFGNTEPDTTTQSGDVAPPEVNTGSDTTTQSGDVAPPEVASSGIPPERNGDTPPPESSGEATDQEQATKNALTAQCNKLRLTDSDIRVQSDKENIWYVQQSEGSRSEQDAAEYKKQVTDVIDALKAQHLADVAAVEKRAMIEQEHYLDVKRAFEDSGYLEELTARHHSFSSSPGYDTNIAGAQEEKVIFQEYYDYATDSRTRQKVDDDHERYLLDISTEITRLDKKLLVDIDTTHNSFNHNSAQVPKEVEDAHVAAQAEFKISIAQIEEQYQAMNCDGQGSDIRAMIASGKKKSETGWMNTHPTAAMLSVKKGLKSLVGDLDGTRTKKNAQLTRKKTLEIRARKQGSKAVMGVLKEIVSPSEETSSAEGEETKRYALSLGSMQTSQKKTDEAYVDALLLKYPLQPGAPIDPTDPNSSIGESIEGPEILAARNDILLMIDSLLIEEADLKTANDKFEASLEKSEESARNSGPVQQVKRLLDAAGDPRKAYGF